MVSNLFFDGVTVKTSNMGVVTNKMENHKTYIRRGRTEIHRDQATVERFNRALAECLFGHQYPVEILLPASDLLRG